MLKDIKVVVKGVRSRLIHRQIILTPTRSAHTAKRVVASLRFSFYLHKGVLRK